MCSSDEYRPTAFCSDPSISASVSLWVLVQVVAPQATGLSLFFVPLQRAVIFEAVMSFSVTSVSSQLLMKLLI